MDRTTAEKIIAVQEYAMKDPHYQTLLQEYRTKDREFQQVILGLSQEQQDVILGYVGICVEMHLRLLELAAIYLA